MPAFQADSDSPFGVGNDHDPVDLSLRENPAFGIVVGHADDDVFPDQFRRPARIERRAWYRPPREPMPSHRGGITQSLPGASKESARILSDAYHGLTLTQVPQLSR